MNEYAISYWCHCPIETEPLSSTVFEIFGPETRARPRTHTLQVILYSRM